VNYQIITDEKILREFINWLPELSPEEVYYCCLFARSKYTKDLEGNNGIPHIKSDKAQLKRFTATKDRLYYKIKQLECPLGSYVQGSQNIIEIPQESLALYITVNPRNLWKATKNSLKHFAEVVVTEGKTMNPQADAMSEIQRSKSRSCYVVADYDKKSLIGVKMLIHLSDLKEGSYRILETRGGYHILIDPEQPTKFNWYKTIKEDHYVDQIGDIMIPVPGTYQGGHTPKFIV
jgi:hypothetical protein